MPDKLKLYAIELVDFTGQPHSQRLFACLRDGEMALTLTPMATTYDLDYAHAAIRELEGVAEIELNFRIIELEEK